MFYVIYLITKLYYRNKGNWSLYNINSTIIELVEYQPLNFSLSPSLNTYIFWQEFFCLVLWNLNLKAVLLNATSRCNTFFTKQQCGVSIKRSDFFAKQVLVLTSVVEGWGGWVRRLKIGHLLRRLNLRKIIHYTSDFKHKSILQKGYIVDSQVRYIT